MYIMPYDPNKVDKNSNKFCQQCRRYKPIMQFLSKNRMSICVLCNLCREKQKQRARGMFHLYVSNGIEKREAQKKELQLRQEAEYSSFSSDSSSNHDSPFLSPHSMDRDSVSMVNNSQKCSVPCSKWIVIDENTLVGSQGVVYKAKLLYRRQK